MAETLEIKIICAEGELASLNATEIYIPAHKGKAGILPHHIPYITLLSFGEVSICDISGKWHYNFVDEGFVEVKDNVVTIISESVVPADKLERSEVDSQLKHVEEKIQSSFKGDISAEELKDALLDKEKWQIKADILDKTTK